MAVRILELDGSLVQQKRFLEAAAPQLVHLDEWGPRIRLACSLGRFARFARVIQANCQIPTRNDPQLTYFGSGDFHHVTLALLQTINEPINLLVLDNHPDWMRGMPFLHCGTWLHHAARLPQVRTIFHVGGEVDFDNYYAPLAPWRLLRSGKIRVAPALRRFRKGPWAHVEHQPLQEALSANKPFASWEKELQCRSLYISLDKDVLRAQESIVNWDSGHLKIADVFSALEALFERSGGRCVGMDVLGDWSPVRVQGLLRRVMHWTMHPSLDVASAEATRCQEGLNLAMLRWWNERVMSSAHPSAQAGALAKAS